MSDINNLEKAGKLFEEIRILSKENYGSVSEFMRTQQRPVAYLNNIITNGKKTGKCPASTISEMKKFLKVLKNEKVSYKKVVTDEMIADIIRAIKDEYRFLKTFSTDCPEYSYMFMINLKDKSGQRITRKVKTLLKMFDLYDKYYSNEDPKDNPVRPKAKDSK